MSSLLLNQDERGSVVFFAWPGLGYGPRLAFSLILIASGLGLQVVGYAVRPAFPGGWLVFSFILLAVGNLLQLTRGCTNRIKAAAFDPDENWQSVDRDTFANLSAFHERVQKWDKSWLDLTNPRGLLTFFVLGAACVLCFLAAAGERRLELAVIGANIGILLVPHWVTGLRTILTTPAVLIKVNLIEGLLSAFRPQLDKHGVEYYSLIKASDVAKLPTDAKFKVDIAGHHPDFLGLYGQVVLNEVQGGKFPYFYCVLVAREGYGLRERVENCGVRIAFTAEFKDQEDVEVFVLRQHTTKTSGYHTKPLAISAIFRAALNIAEKVAC